MKELPFLPTRTRVAVSVAAAVLAIIALFVHLVRTAPAEHSSASVRDLKQSAAKMETPRNSDAPVSTTQEPTSNPQNLAGSTVDCKPLNLTVERLTAGEHVPGILIISFLDRTVAFKAAEEHSDADLPESSLAEYAVHDWGDDVDAQLVLQHGDDPYLVFALTDRHLTESEKSCIVGTSHGQ